MVKRQTNVAVGVAGLPINTGKQAVNAPKSNVNAPASPGRE